METYDMKNKKTKIPNKTYCFRFYSDTGWRIRLFEQQAVKFLAIYPAGPGSLHAAETIADSE